MPFASPTQWKNPFRCSNTGAGIVGKYHSWTIVNMASALYAPLSATCLLILLFCQSPVLSMGTILYFLCPRFSLKVGFSGWFAVNLPSVLRQGAMLPWRRTYILSRYFSRYKFELRLPFSRQRYSLEISSASQRSSRARLTVERESCSWLEIVRIPH